MNTYCPDCNQGCDCTCAPSAHRIVAELEAENVRLRAERDEGRDRMRQMQRISELYLVRAESAEAERDTLATGLTELATDWREKGQRNAARHWFLRADELDALLARAALSPDRQPTDGACPHCEGSGRSAEPCWHCGGTGNGPAFPERTKQ